MGTVILISTVAIIVAVVGCFVIWRLDASRAEEVDRTPPPPVAGPQIEARATTPPRPLEQ
jgi:hypothetical protein